MSLCQALRDNRLFLSPRGDSLSQWLADVVAGTATAEPLPQGGVAADGVRLVFAHELPTPDDDADVCVLFFNQNCMHCQEALAPYAEFARSVADVAGTGTDASVVVAKFDTSLDEVPSHVPLDGFPTVVLFPAGGRAAVPYDGDTADPVALYDWLAAHTTYTQDLPRRSDAQRFHGKDVFPAILRGLEVAKAQLDAAHRRVDDLTAENRRLRQQLEDVRLRERGSKSTLEQKPNPSH